MTTMLDQRWNCGLCGWRGVEAELIRHPSGPFGCPQCARTEWLSGSDTRAKTETGITLSTGCPERQECMGCEVELMHVPRCQTCRWWAGDTDWPYASDCRRHLTNPPAGFFTEQLCEECDDGRFAKLITWPDFGCVQWEAKRDE